MTEERLPRRFAPRNDITFSYEDGWGFASGSGQNLSAGVYLPAARIDSASVPKKTLRLRVPQDTAYAGTIRDSGP